MIKLVKMGESESNQSERKIDHKIKYKESIGGGVKVSEISEGKVSLDVGNSGLSLDITLSPQGNTVEVHFSPEGFTPATTTGQKVRNVRAFGFALYELIQWLKQNPNYLKDIEEAQIVGTTNETFAEFITKVFAGTKSPMIVGRTRIAKDASEDNILKFRLKDLIELPQDSPFFSRLKKLHDSCQGMILHKTMVFPFDWSPAQVNSFLEEHS